MTARNITIRRHTMELCTAAGIGILAALVVYASLQLKVGWSATGPESGYFPLRIGLLLLAVSLGLFVQAARGGKEHQGKFADGEQLARSVAVFVPTLIFVAAMPFLGCYVATLLYLLYMARAMGRFSWLRAGSIAVIATALFFAVFEIWFQVPLVKGPLESWLGLY